MVYGLSSVDARFSVRILGGFWDDTNAWPTAGVTAINNAVVDNGAPLPRTFSGPGADVRVATPVQRGPDGRPLTPPGAAPWSRAYLAWVDQYADNPNLHPDPADQMMRLPQLLLRDPDHTGYRWLPMVPEAAGPGGAPDGNGYATNGRALNWQWPGWDAGLRELQGSFDGTLLRLEVQQCSVAPGAVYAPACILTNATLLGVV